MVNIAKKLKNAKKDTTLWSPLFGPVTLVDAGQMIYVNTNDGRSECFDENGRYFFKSPGCCYSVDCLLFPGKDQTWDSVEIKHPYKKKFEVGDWITDGWNPPVKVSGFSLGFTYYFSEGNIASQGWKVAEENYHIWTLKDAKPGDVLAFDWAEENGHVQKDGSVKWQKIVIFKSLNGNTVEGYGCTFVNNKLTFIDVETPYYSKTWSNTLKPATQEQRDLLYATMEKAGYKWDSDKQDVVKCAKSEPNAIEELSIEPKYKLGDWVVYCGNVYLVDDINKTTYTFASAKTGAELINDIVVVDNSSSYRLWRISDAISGDVLTDYADGFDNPLIFILKGFEHVDFGLKRPSDYSSYCFLKANTRQDFLKGSYHHKHNIKPATYEQRKLLFMKMDEAGYCWNEETKKLTKYPSPKFKVGSWLIQDVNHKYSSDIFYVSKALKDTYVMVDVDGVEYNNSRFNTEKYFRLWNIKDAQNGDVLAAHEVIVLFKEIDGLNIRTHFSYHYMNTPMVFTNDLHNKDAFSPATKDERERLFKKIAEEGYKWDDNEKELKELMYNAGKFNVGDWITDGNATAQICSICNGCYLYGDRCILGDIKDVDKNYHLWSIEDAKVGDVLSNNNVICIFAGLDKDKNIFSPCMYTSQHGLEVFSSGEECMGSTLLRPATQKDCDILFSELEEAGYRWDENNCELVLLVKQLPKHNDKKNKHYDINNFYIGMDVLCRDDNVSEWCYLKFSHYSKTSDIGHFNAGGSHWQQCIPLEGNERLLGKFDECDSFYVNW